jgi:hypothetical protein
MKICTPFFWIALISLQCCFTDLALAADACDFQPPMPILADHAYAGQTVKRKPNHEITETAKLPNGMRIEIRQSACVDIVTTEYALIVPIARSTSENQGDLIELLRNTIPALKRRASSPQPTGITDFLKHVNEVPLRDGTRSVCKDGSIAKSGECSWESTGGYVLSVKPVGRSRRISVIEYVSA